MMTADATYDKLTGHRQIFDTLPNVLTQDPARERAYFIKAKIWPSSAPHRPPGRA